MRPPSLAAARRRRHVAAALATLLVLAPQAHGSSALADPSEPRFGDSTWVAPYAIAGEPTDPGPRVAPPDHARAWETTVRAPFHALGLPFRWIGGGAEWAAGRFGERFVTSQQPKAPVPGTHVAPTVNISGLNDIGFGPAVTWSGPRATARFSATWSTLDRRKATLNAITSGRRIGWALHASYERKPNKRFYGLGPGSREEDRSHYLLEAEGAEVNALLGRDLLRQTRVIAGFSSMSPGKAYNTHPLIEDVFTAEQAPGRDQATYEWYAGVGGDYARLDDARDPAAGWHGRFDLRRELGMRAQDPDFDQWLLEARGYLPVGAKRRVFAARAVYAGVEPRSGTLPFYRLLTSDGPLRLAGYASERFRDEQLVLGRLEYRWAILQRLNALLLMERAAVAPRLGAFAGAGHTAYGGGLRLGVGPLAAVRAEAARGTEGWDAVIFLGSDW